MRIDFTPIRFMDPQADLRAAQELVETVEVLKDSFKSLGIIIKQQVGDNIQDADRFTKAYGKTLANDITKNLTTMGKRSEDILKNQKLLIEGQAKEKDILKQITQAEEKRKSLLIDLKSSLKSGAISQKQYLKYVSEILTKTEEQTRELAKQAKEADKIEKRMGNLGKLVTGLNKIPIVGQFTQTEKVMEAMQKRAATTASKTQVMLTGFKEIGKNIKAGILDPLTIITFLLTQVVKAEKQIIALNKSLVVTRGEAFLIREQFVEQSRAINDTAITTDKLLEAQSKLSDALGITKIFSQGINQEFINLTQKVKISEEAAIGLSKATLATGKNARQITVNAVSAIEKVKQETKLRLDNRKILEQTGKVSGQLLANFKANPAAIAEAIAKTQALGTTLEQTKNQAESLLNFESSIENELKAELITGKQINLERARMAALMGDQKAVAEELSAQAVDFNTFSEMNVIAQKSLAEALGLSADALSDQLFQQQYLNKSQEEILALGGKEALQRMEQLTAQEKFNNAVDKLKDLLGNLVAGPLGSMLSLLSDALQIVTLIGVPFRLIGDMINGILEPASSLSTILKGILFTTIAIATFRNPLLALGSLAALGGAILITESLIKPKKQEEFADGGIVLSEINNATIGEAGPEAIIPLNSPKADKILGGTSVDLTPMIAAINEVKAAINNLGSRPSVAYINGKDAFSKEVSTTSVQNTYKFA